MANSGKSNRGFASMDPEKQRQIASKGGQRVPPEERSFSKDPALAASAGRKGGQASHGARSQSMNASSDDGSSDSGGFSSDQVKAAHAGRKGGQRSHGGERPQADR